MNVLPWKFQRIETLVALGICMEERASRSEEEGHQRDIKDTVEQEPGKVTY